MTSVEIRQIKHEFKHTKVLDRLDLDVKSNEYLVLLGASGSGKTTILKIIAGLICPLGGSVLSDGHCLDRIAPRDRSVAMVSQGPSLYPHLTVRKSIAIGQAKRDEGIAAAAIDAMGIGELLDRYPGELSGGQQKRAAIAKALASGKSIRLLDEPLAALDQPVRTAIETELLSWHQKYGGTTIHVTHDGNEAMRMADRIAVIGRSQDAFSVIQCDQPSNIYNSPASIDVAKSVGVLPINLVPATLQSGRLCCDSESIEIVGDWSNIRFSETGQPNAKLRSVFVGIRPETLGKSLPQFGGPGQSPETNPPAIKLTLDSVRWKCTGPRWHASSPINTSHPSDQADRSVHQNTTPIHLIVEQTERPEPTQNPITQNPITQNPITSNPASSNLAPLAPLRGEGPGVRGLPTATLNAPPGQKLIVSAAAQDLLIFDAVSRQRLHRTDSSENELNPTNTPMGIQ